MKSISIGAFLLLQTGLVVSFSSSPAQQAQQQAVLQSQQSSSSFYNALRSTDFSTDQSYLQRVLQDYSDPVDAFEHMYSGARQSLAEPRLLALCNETKSRWMTEGDKLRLKRADVKFVDVTDHQDHDLKRNGTLGDKPHLPELEAGHLIKPLFPQIQIERMKHVLEKMTSFYNRWYGGVTGEQSAQWLHDHIAAIISESPFHTHISLEFFTHAFPQPSIIARFEPKVRNSSLPLTILGAHQDSANYYFPLLPAPGADDDCSGTVSILEAFRVLAHSGYIPLNGPVEFHWYAGEEGGLLGSRTIASDKRQSGANIGAMLEFDMTAYVARNATESIGLIRTQADGDLTKWLSKLSEKYISIPVHVYDLPGGAGSDYMSYTAQGYPAAFASEGNPLGEGGAFGEFDPYVHTAKDTMYVDDEFGYFSLDHMARFSELAIAFVVEQAGWNNAWR